MYGLLVEISNPTTAAEVRANAIAVRGRMKQREAASVRQSLLVRMERQVAEDEARRRVTDELYQERFAAKPVNRDFILVASAPVLRADPEGESAKSDKDRMETALMREFIGFRSDAFTHARKILIWVCRRYGWSPQDLCGSRRQANIVQARHLAIQLICHTNKCKILTLVQIGKLFGGKDHTTILHAATKAPSYRARRPIMSLMERAQSGTIRSAEVRR